MHDHADESTRSHFLLEPAEVLEVVGSYNRPSLDFHAEQIAFAVLNQKVYFPLVGIAVLPDVPAFESGPDGQFVQDPRFDQPSPVEEDVGL